MRSADALPHVQVFNTYLGADEYLTGLGYVLLYNVGTWVDTAGHSAFVVQAPTGKWLVHIMEDV